MRSMLLALGLCFLSISSLVQPTSAKTLDIDPVAQQTPEWCWAAASQMVLSYYNAPNLNPGGNFQCGVVGAQGGMCSYNCGMCLGAGGTTQRIAAVIQAYLMAAQMMTGFNDPGLHISTTGVLSPQEIIDMIDNDAPIIAGISPGSIPYPPGLGFSQHAVVVVGYTGTANALNVILNDPYPYPPYAVPYLQAGGQALQPGRYRIPYGLFLSVFHYGNSILFN
ncbi:Peptidase_C39 like family protein [Enhydrobacter aerosaccus]|uniref:Peptidase_C39 like family protein n=1 Tax=Enhydrobacter aerosaccus TaxID=225324 RepID=A0A1T4NBN9_9HYPH|nr:papain-like cysteine protease family protein [Enhydrobacter aerosaccus]SJZ76447.1 Peptidase_C39 like family protein [Enhydrobacter aerosaccus]